MMKYIEIENSPAVRTSQAVQKKRKKSRHRRFRRFVRNLVLVIAVIYGMLYAASTLWSRKDNWKDDVPPVSATDPAGTNDADGGSDALSRLKSLARDNSEIAAIVRNADAYPESLLKLLASNQEALSFVQNYPSRSSLKSSGLTKDDLTGEIPLFLQWDKRWGYNEYGTDMLAITGCGPTCLSMVIAGLTGDLSANPGAVAAFSQSHGYCVDGNGTDWSLMTAGAKAYGLTVTEVPLWKSSIIEQLHDGHPVICAVGPGEFTTTGHFIVIYGYEDGEFLINDPNSIARSMEHWTYESFEKQVRNLWAYSAK